MSASCTVAASSAGGADAPPPEPVAVSLTTSVPDGEVGVSPLENITVTAADGTLTGVTMTNPKGVAVTGDLSADKLTWTSNQTLGYGTTYTVETKARGEAGAVTEQTDFTTLKPKNQTLAAMLPSGGATVGVGQPAVVIFDEPITDRQAAQDAITITADPPVEGAFYWMSNVQLHWRPEAYWAPGTQVRIDVNTYGKDLGNGLYGQEDNYATFNIGDEVIAVADDSTKMINISVNGNVVKSMPTSMGKSKFATPNGTYIIAERHESMIMDSSTYGLAIDSPDGYKTPVNWATRMSYSGIFVHSAPWSMWAQGNTNTSHGCLNVSPADAQWFYNNTKRGDITMVKNTVGETLAGTDGLGDWNIPWSTWKAGNASA
nr:Ig-like domain-containing protein [Tomitella biformata]